MPCNQLLRNKKMEQVRLEKLKLGVEFGFEEKWLEEYIHLLPENNLQLLEDDIDVLLLCYLKYRNAMEIWLPSQHYKSWRILGFTKLKSKEMSKAYRESGWIGDHQNALYFAIRHTCDSIDYKLRVKYGVKIVEYIQNLMIGYRGRNGELLPLPVDTGQQYSDSDDSDSDE